MHSCFCAKKAWGCTYHFFFLFLKITCSPMTMIKHRISLKHINRPCKEELIKLSWTHSRVLCGNYSNFKHFIPDLSLQSLPRNSLLYFCLPVVHSIDDFKLEITPWRRIRTISDVSSELQVKGNATEIRGHTGSMKPFYNYQGENTGFWFLSTC